MNEKKEFDGIKIGALWISKNSEGVMTGSLGNARLLALPNKFKTKDSQPDIRLFVTPKNKNDDDNSGAPF